MERSFVTWNVAGLNPGADERTEAQCLHLLLTDPPHAIALQEVVRRTWYAHWRPHLAAAGYRVFPADPTDTDSEYFSLLAVRGPEGELLPWSLGRSRMGRRMVAVRAGGWVYCTAHLESERAGSDLRVEQAAAVAGHLAACAGPAVFGGDTNLRVEEEPRVRGLGAVVDAWAVAGALAAHRVTWRGGKASARWDRVWCNAEVAVRSFELGHVAAPLSDHLPARVRLVRPS
jgi:endonuclease/exonuclease/phosphatase (EEP) superfamily protein YafD